MKWCLIGHCRQKLMGGLAVIDPLTLARPLSPPAVLFIPTLPSVGSLDLCCEQSTRGDFCSGGVGITVGLVWILPGLNSQSTDLRGSRQSA